MSEWTLSHERDAQRCINVSVAHGEAYMALRHIGDALGYVVAGKFEEAHWEFWWAQMTNTIPWGVDE